MSETCSKAETLVSIVIRTLERTASHRTVASAPCARQADPGPISRSGGPPSRHQGAAISEQADNPPGPKGPDRVWPCGSKLPWTRRPPLPGGQKGHRLACSPCLLCTAALPPTSQHLHPHLHPRPHLHQHSGMPRERLFRESTYLQRGVSLAGCRDRRSRPCNNGRRPCTAARPAVALADLQAVHLSLPYPALGRCTQIPDGPPVTTTRKAPLYSASLHDIIFI